MAKAEAEAKYGAVLRETNASYKVQTRNNKR